MFLKAVKVLFYVLRELVFDNKEEYDYRSTKFNTRKFIATSVMMLSIIMNVFTFTAIYKMGLENARYRKYCSPKTELAKKPPSAPSDR